MGGISLILGLGFLYIVFIIGLFVLLSYPLYLASKQANLKNPGFAFIPGLNIINFYNLANLSAWWFWLVLIGSFIPFVGILISAIMSMYIGYRIARNFGLSTGWVILTSLFTILGYIYISIDKRVPVCELNPKFTRNQY